eukprot:CAMPEP_0198733792 /NCGR_PEP_ID=MMETSP1475-20131203/48256_1 /TAXON_ID= ORGANISM="Unidentified sp., Strain CCMP1999" /NCGR_SAMPLE_ID=MMETSP1475 /ASSEMBLY_ACC=CAM_ASM_001111 /LENGTH=356 /DNA_ID=CAMNT_0044497145 /DNA_START=220 /DNA_END=1290 /DNA_ORIENTATION=-
MKRPELIEDVDDELKLLRSMVQIAEPDGFPEFHEDEILKGSEKGEVLAVLGERFTKRRCRNKNAGRELLVEVSCSESERVQWMSEDAVRAQAAEVVELFDRRRDCRDKQPITQRKAARKKYSRLALELLEESDCEMSTNTEEAPTVQEEEAVERCEKNTRRFELLFGGCRCRSREERYLLQLQNLRQSGDGVLASRTEAMADVNASGPQFVYPLNVPAAAVQRSFPFFAGQLPSPSSLEILNMPPPDRQNDSSTSAVFNEISSKESLILTPDSDQMQLSYPQRKRRKPDKRPLFDIVSKDVVGISDAFSPPKTPEESLYVRDQLHGENMGRDVTGVFFDDSKAKSFGSPYSRPPCW